MLLTGSHVEFRGGNAQKLYWGKSVKQVENFNQGMIMLPSIHTWQARNLIPEVNFFCLFQVLSD
jgi:hypothetical protein